MSSRCRSVDRPDEEAAAATVLGRGGALLRLLGLRSPPGGGRRDLTTALAVGVFLAAPFVPFQLAFLKLIMDRPQELEEIVGCIFVATILFQVFVRFLCFVFEGPTVLDLEQLLIETGASNSSCECSEDPRRRNRRLGDHVFLTVMSESLMHSAYRSAWVDFDTRSRRSLLTFATESRRPLEIKVGKMYALNRESLLQVLNGSYALFNMLYGFQSNK